MKGVSQFVVNVCDLLEAEGRSLRTVVRDEAVRARTATATMAMRFALMLIAIPIVVGGVGLLAMSMMRLLEPPLGAALAMGLTGAAVLAAGAGLLAACGALGRGPTV